MVISQLLVNKIEWNKFHFVANLIAFKINTYLTSDYTSIFFLGMKIPLSSFFSDTVCITLDKFSCGGLLSGINGKNNRTLFDKTMIVFY